ncbi:plasmid segregation protein ParM [Clostridium acetobutylicum]|uniref:Predicted ATPase of HSP70 class n=1 Tax=Clostridium acetobutylicum (strain ATCC 824 / DSM 792 / JCM 1419 / IAM 19013 / LMG 5710 / NBRC 13948 / NRRL B-527 / VKM B-1787 / 2291 / W) TaxID=272562 RepID=Q97JW2_CLOAB|nr:MULTISPECIES: ParM/StbA family protein [Clostridium]AAK79133.1 Predicted ATPase of HSP70 class [Clostridium acetobutylicum ATCC 824]ADZ20211.1 ATPase of HSP70 class [Clostridium acetobutylicum EA 2018]AEI31669.1 ATPase of HSP70 class [Clostridium acetobutylicum DSM 1731]AWV81614.1 heat-shock protein Hsp70 [Clostridium acetobutylicum]MBC2393257.1 ParM/StbA family protein [Clostridium acetobutylicum]
MITVVDLGNFNIKYKSGSNQGNFSSKITDYQPYPEGFERIQMQGESKITYLGVGELNKEFNKVARNYLPQLLYAICRANNYDNIETNLVTLLPIVQMKNKEKMIENLKEKEFNFQFNGEKRKVLINDTIVLPEGYATYFSLSEEDKESSLCIIDLGSRTINICVLQDGAIQLLHTIKLGSFDFYTKVKTRENSKGEDYTEEDIPRLVENGTIEISDIEYEDFLTEVLNEVKAYVNLKTYKVIWTGGTALMLKEQIEKLPLNNSKLHNDPLNSNTNGAAGAAEIIWQSEEE